LIVADNIYFNYSGSTSSRVETAEFKQNSREIPVSPENYNRNCIYLRELTIEDIPSEMIYINCCLLIQIENESKVFPLKYISEKGILILNEEISQMKISNFEEKMYSFKMQILFSTDYYQTLNNISKRSILNGKIWLLTLGLILLFMGIFPFFPAFMMAFPSFVDFLNTLKVVLGGITFLLIVMDWSKLGL